MRTHAVFIAVIAVSSFGSATRATPPETMRGVNRDKPGAAAQSGLHRRDWLAAGVYSRASGRLLPSGSAVRSGEEIFLSVELRKAAFLYVISQTDDGPFVTVYPNRARKDFDALRPAGTYEIPGKDEDTLYFDGKPGRESFIVVASHRRLDESQIAKVIQQATRASAPKSSRRRRAGMGASSNAGVSAAPPSTANQSKSRPFAYNTRGVGRRPKLADGRERVKVAPKGAFSLVEIWLDHRN